MSALWSGVQAELRARSASQPAPDLAPFVRASLAAGGAGPLGSALSTAALRATRELDPARVPLEMLRAMGSHPIVYLAERTISGIVRRPDLYYVRHSDKRVVKETEAWLWPLLPELLGALAHAFAYGAVPVVLDWGEGDLRIEVPSAAGGVRNRTLVGHRHYVRAHELWPGDVEIEAEGDELLAVRHGKGRYLADRAAVFVWDREFGSFAGQGARRRAWRDFVASLGVTALKVRYLERSVDSPRVAWAPSGSHTVDGAEVAATEYVATLLQTLKGSGTITFPSARDTAGNKQYELETLDVPDRGAVWDAALNRFDGGILKAYLVPPSLTGVEDLAASGARILDGMLKEFIQDLAQFAADALTRLVRRVHEQSYDPARVPPPEILAYEIPAAVRKLYLEVLKLVGAANAEQSPASWVDVPALLDQLGVPLRTSPVPVVAASGGQPPGRPRDATSERQERRERARTSSGEDAVGAPDEQNAEDGGE